MALLSYENLIDPILRSVRLSTPDFSGMQAGDRVLDVCCGTGAQIIEYGRRGIRATGIDIDENMLDVALKNKKKLDAANASFFLADATALPFDDGSFDYVSISFALHDKDRDTRNGVVSEMKRVIKPEGALVFIDYRVPISRNVLGIAATAIEYFVGGAHYRGFKDFTGSGGIKKILETHSLKEEKAGYFKGGLVTMVKAVL
ncbi:MAG: methyltransferase domain-containing protein [Dehalococcoidales bacterium]|nr:methyltransferase domain-containing protein [Dehalococcoidales bacterium]